MVNEKYNIELEVLTPLCVGAGNDAEWNIGSDYVQHNGKVYVLDIKKAVEHGVDVDKLSYLLCSPDEGKIVALYGNALEASSKYVFDLPAITTNPIKSFMRTGLHERPIVAGSSLKGAMRSSLFKYLRVEGQKSNADVFGSMKDGTDFMRFVKVRDIEMGETVLVNTKLFNLRKDEDADWAGGWKKELKSTVVKYSATGFNTLYECAAPGQKGVGEILMSEMQFSTPPKMIELHSYDKKKKVLSDISHLFSVINSNTKSYLEKELEFFRTFPADRTDEIIESIERLLSTIPSDNSYCVMKMSAGVGFHSITGNWQYEDYIDEPGLWTSGKDNGKKKYKSRKIAEYNGTLQLMGFVKLSVIPDDMYQSAIDQIREESDKKLSEVRAAIETAQNAKAEEQRRKAEERESRLKLERYEDLFYQAVRLENSDPEKACELAKAAAEILPEESRHVALLSRIEAARIKAEQTVKIAKDYSQPLKAILSGLKPYMAEIVKETKRWMAAGNTLSADSLKDLAVSVSALPDKEQKKIRDLSKILSKAEFKELQSMV